MSRIQNLALALLAAFILSIAPSFAAPAASPAAAKTPAASAAKSQNMTGTISNWDAAKNTFTLTGADGKAQTFTWKTPINKKGNTAVFGKPANGAKAQVWYTGSAAPYTATRISIAK